jgi:predicted small secreted protein
MKFIFVMIAVVGLSACGNTISGIGSDISGIGKKVTTWQNKPSKPEPVKELPGPKTSSSFEKKHGVVLKPESGA